MKKTIAFLQLMRPANIVTSVSDVLAGMAVSGFFVQDIFSFYSLQPVILLCIAAIGLYGGGVVFNDVFDAALDKIERPERAIPSGVVTIIEASMMGFLLLATGVIAAYLVNNVCGLLAFLIAVSALVYNKWGKHHFLLGPLNMGLCRGLNLLLGVSIIPLQLYELWYLAIVPIIYIAAITTISRGEVHGGTKAPLYLATFLYVGVIGAVLYFSFTRGMMLLNLVFLIPFAYMIFNPLLKAIQQPLGKNIGKAVKAGVIALILLNASWAVASGALWVALLIILLLPLSLLLAKMFAVT